jgi:histone deacetylase complex subunit SAP18
VVLGRGGPGAGPEEGVPDEPDDGAAMTLADARFITGDLISCAILPPDELTGDVMPASSARTGRGVGVGEARVLAGGSLPPPKRHSRDFGPPGGFRGRGSRGGGGGWGYGGGRNRDWDQSFGRGGGGGGSVPEGEWRRGDKLPDDVPKRGAFRAR